MPIKSPVFLVVLSLSLYIYAGIGSNSIQGYRGVNNMYVCNVYVYNMSCYVLWNCVPSCYAMQCNIVYSMSVCFCMCIKGHHVCQILNNLTLGESHSNMTLGHRVPSSHGGKSAKVRFSFWFFFWYLKLLVSQTSFFKGQKVWEGMMLGMFSSISTPRCSMIFLYLPI